MSDLSSSGHSAHHLIHQVAQCADDLFGQKVRNADLTPRQFIVLRAIAKQNGVSQTELVEVTGIDRSTMTGLIRRLLAKKLIARRRTKHDARAYSIQITEKGLELCEASVPLAASVDADILDSLPTAQRILFIQSLAKIVSALKAE